MITDFDLEVIGYRSSQKKLISLYRRDILESNAFNSSLCTSTDDDINNFCLKQALACKGMSSKLVYAIQNVVLQQLCRRNL